MLSFSMLIVIMMSLIMPSVVSVIVKVRIKYL
jgi:hypothetical protein